MPVGWNCTNSMSCNGRPARSAMPPPSPVQGAVVELQGGDAAAGAVFHDEVEREVFDEEVDGVLQRLAVERVEHGVASAVGRRAGALDRGFAIILGHAAKGALINLAFLG